MLRIQKISEHAVLPRKGHDSDAGFDVVGTHAIETRNGVTYIGTGLRVQPPDGCFLALFPRSSVSKTQYMLANGVGVIDPDYRGELIVAMRHVGSEDPPPPWELPQRIAQLVALPIVPAIVVEADLGNTERGCGGFGSTGKH